MTSTPQSEPRRSATMFIFVTIVLDMLALGIIIPVLPKLVIHFSGGDTARGAEFYGLFGSVWALMHFLASPVLGALSDRFGRRPVILLSNFGLGLDYILMALAPSLGWLFAGRMISGITAASIPTGYAYLSDTTPPEKRAAAFGKLGAAFGIGFVLGPALGGLLGAINPRLPFWAAAILSLTNAAYGYFILPESLAVEKRAPFSWRRANPIGSLTLLRSHAKLFGLATAYFLSMLAHAVLPSVYVLYTSYRYGWNERATGLSLAAVGVCSGLVQSLLIGRVILRLGEKRTLLTGVGFGVAGFVIAGWAPTTFWFWVSIPFISLWGIANPATQAFMTRLVAPSQQGQLQGANSSLAGMGEFFGPMLFTLTFSFFITRGESWHAPGAPFWLAALLLTGSGLTAWRILRKYPDP